MPGINFYYTFAAVSPSKRTMILDHGSECNDQNYPSTILIDDEHSVLTCRGYEGYPFISFETEEFQLFLEGCIYSEDDGTIKVALTRLAENLVKGADDAARERIRSWLLDADGEFIAVMLHKLTGVVYIVTDALGRLPLYYSRDEQSIMVSRHMDLVAAVQERKEYNKLAIAQYLLFGYSLGRKTLIKNVHGLKPSSVITIDPRSSLIDLQCVHTFSFSEKQHSGKSVEANATELAHLLTMACLSRTNSKRCHVVSLSGGLDSRTVAACIRKTGIPVSAATMIDLEGTFRADADIAEQIARALGIDWKLYKLQAPRWKDAYRLLSMKTGLNGLSMSFILQFLDKLRSAHGPGMDYITGDGGDKLLVDLRPKSSLRSLSDLVQYILSRHQRFSLEDVSRMTGIPECDIIDGVSEHVGSYPEQDWDGKLVHFVIFERGRRWLFEGEDRNRNFFWHLAPFYGIQFFRYAMNCPDEQKANHRLYKEVLVRLSAEAADIQNAHWGFPITSKRYYWVLFKRYLLDMVPTEFRKRIKQQLRQNSIPKESYKECVSKQVENCDVIKNYLMFPEVIKQLDRCTKRDAQTLLTVASTLELVASGRSTLREYWDDEF